MEKNKKGGRPKYVIKKSQIDSMIVAKVGKDVQIEKEKESHDLAIERKKILLADAERLQAQAEQHRDEAGDEDDINKFISQHEAARILKIEQARKARNDNDQKEGKLLDRDKLLHALEDVFVKIWESQREFVERTVSRLSNDPVEVQVALKEWKESLQAARVEIAGLVSEGK